MEDLEEGEQMKIQELMWNQQRKMQGLPTSDDLVSYISSKIFELPLFFKKKY